MTKLISRRNVLKTGAASFLGALFDLKEEVGSIAAAHAGEIKNGYAANSSLKELAVKKGLFFGAAVKSDALEQDPLYGKAVLSDCSIVVPDSELKWGWIQGGRRDAALDYSRAESIYSYFHPKGVKMRGHALLWHRSLPSWIGNLPSETTVSDAEGLLVSHVSEVVKAWKGRLIHWDVVNEPLSAGPDYVWTRLLGEQYIDLAFHVARDSDPNSLLVLNQELIESDDPYQRHRRYLFIDLLERLLKRGVPLDAVGVEGHLYGHLKINSKEYDDFLSRIEALGLKLIITELDVWDGRVVGAVSERDKHCASLVKDFLDVSLSHKNCQGVLTWTITDRYSWYLSERKKSRLDGLPVRGGLLDMDYQRKPIWSAVASALMNAPTR